MLLATPDDVVARLGRDLTTAETARLAGLLAEASAIVEGYLGITYPEDTDPVAVPDPVSIVVSRIVARALTLGIPEGVTQQSETAGPFAHSNTYGQGLTSLWLGKAEKLMLRSLGGGVTSVPMRSERF